MRSQKKRNVITIITRIAIIGIASITCALVLLLSAFNGMEKLIDQIYSEFDASITVTPKSGKTFSEKEVDWKAIESIEGVSTLAKGREELIVIEYGLPLHEQKDYRIKRTNAKLYAIDPAFLEVIHLKEHFKGEQPVLEDAQGPLAIMGIGLINKLEASLSAEFSVFVPKKNITVRAKEPFMKQKVYLSSVLAYQNKQVNEETLLWPLDAFRKMIRDTTDQISHIYIRTLEGENLDQIKGKIENKLGDHFLVKTYLQKNELIFKTSKSEKFILTLILIFVFILACFNLVSSITMIYLEKKGNLLALKSMGLTRKGIFQIFFFQGIQISAIGSIIGGALGYIICFTQLKYGFLEISPGQAYPIGFSFMDFITIALSVTILTTLFSFTTVKLLTRKQKEA